MPPDRGPADTDETRSLVVGTEARREDKCPQLYLAFDCARPAAAPCRMALADVDEVVIGRGPARRIERTASDGRRVLRLALDDPFLSTVHARLVPLLGRWRLDDAGSKNGSLVNGAPTRQRVLLDGDVLEMGTTFLVYGAGALQPADAALDAEADAGPAAGLRTLLPELRRAFARLADVARSTVSVVVRGEVGTGKEVVARAVHVLSGRRGAFTAVNCGAIPAGLVESELFGHRKGAFTGALADRPGLVRSADQGTLFLDEIAELPASSQAAFLRVLQEREVLPIGATRSVPLDLRVVAATHRDLSALVAEGLFRADLHSRLGGFALELPPLRARRADLGLLIAALLPPAVKVAPAAARCLFRADWPGNVRDLERALATAAVLAGGRTIELEHLPAALQARPAVPPPAPEPEDGTKVDVHDGDTEQALPLHEAARRDALAALLTEHHGNVSAIARLTGKAPMQIRRWLKRWGLHADSYRK